MIVVTEDRDTASRTEINFWRYLSSAEIALLDYLSDPSAQPQYKVQRALREAIAAQKAIAAQNASVRELRISAYANFLCPESPAEPVQAYEYMLIPELLDAKPGVAAVRDESEPVERWLSYSLKNLAVLNEHMLGLTTVGQEQPGQVEVLYRVHDHNLAVLLSIERFLRQMLAFIVRLIVAMFHAIPPPVWLTTVIRQPHHHDHGTNDDPDHALHLRRVQSSAGSVVMV